MIDGTGQSNGGGHSWFNEDNSVSVRFALPATAAGLVWTDGDTSLTNVYFEAFDELGSSLGVVEGGDLSDGVFTGTTAEDRFFGIRFGDGIETWISRVEITNVGGEGIEIDHIQFEHLKDALLGDVNRDGRVDVLDVDALTNAIRADDQSAVFDLDGDNTVGKSDREFLLSRILNVYPGDTDLNGRVGFDDFLSLSKNFGESDAGWSEGNFNFDSTVGFDDFEILSTNFGRPWHDATLPTRQSQFDVLDTSRDGNITPSDVLIILDFLKNPASKVATPYHLDVEQDDLISTLDAQKVIRHLNTQSRHHENSVDSIGMADVVFAGKDLEAELVSAQILVTLSTDPEADGAARGFQKRPG